MYKYYHIRLAQSRDPQNTWFDLSSRVEPWFTRGSLAVGLFTFCYATDRQHTDYNKNGVI